MLRRLHDLKGYAIAASDGEIGSVADFLFEDQSSAIRWVVVDTGTWLSGRQVLLSPTAFTGIDAAGQRMATDLTRDQVERSPDLSSDEPVSRRMENLINAHYGWQPYWHTSQPALFLPWGGAALAVPGPAAEPLDPVGEEVRQRELNEGDPRLQSAGAVVGYTIRAADGDIGHVEDLLADEALTTIHAVLVDTRNWLPGRKVVVPIGRFRDVDWTDEAITTDLTRQQIQDSPEFDPTATAGGHGFDLPQGAALWRQ
jgi:hypothetical protein